MRGGPLDAGLCAACLLSAGCGLRHEDTQHEAELYLGYVVRGAVAAYDREQPDGTHSLCGSASEPIPLAGPIRRFVATPDMWKRDETAGRGFACLRVSFPGDQDCQYGYDATASDFEAWARCDADEDGLFARYVVQGRVGPRGLDLSAMTVENEGE